MMMKAMKAVQEDNNFDFANKLKNLSLEDQQTQVRSLLRSLGTDVEHNDADLFGNGDQSVFRTVEDRARARELFSYGGDLHAATQARAFSPLALACLYGEPALVQKMIDDVCSTKN